MWVTFDQVFYVVALGRNDVKAEWMLQQGSWHLQSTGHDQESYFMSPVWIWPLHCIEVCNCDCSLALSLKFMKGIVDNIQQGSKPALEQALATIVQALHATLRGSG